MSTIDEYLDKIPPSQREELERIRTIAKKMVPQAEETISYGIPTLKYNKKYLIYFGAAKNHMAIYGTTRYVTSSLEKFEVSKGTIKFTEDNPIPESIIKEIITNRLKDIQ